MHRPLRIKTGIAAAAAALALLAGNAAAQYAVSQLPTLTAAPPTNVVVMMDDSGSMGWAFVPDPDGGCTGTRRFNAANFNGLAFNPNIVYQSPIILTPTGATKLTSGGFNAAWIDGFNTTASNSQQVNLATGYQPTASSAPGTTQQTYSPHPAQDLTLIGVSSAGDSVGSPCPYVGDTGNGQGGGQGNQFGPATGSNTLIPAAAYYYVYDSTQTSPAACSAPNTTATSLNAASNDDNCYRYVPVTTSSVPAGAKDSDGTPMTGLDNFANWYSFYRTRHLMIASAAALGMADPVLTGARVTWRALNSCTDMVSGKGCAGWDQFNVDNRLRTFTGTHVTDFYRWLTRVPAANPTPTRSTWTYIGDYFSAPSSSNSALGSTPLGPNGPYGINPNQPNTDPNGGEVACVQNYNITLTDGQWNRDDNWTFSGPADNTTVTLPDGNVYSPSTSEPMAVYSNDPNASTLSDVAFKYWATNLRPDLNGSATAVTPFYQVTTGPGNTPTTTDYWNPQNDPATWPHVVQITIGIGMTATMSNPSLPWWGNNPATQYLLDPISATPGAAPAALLQGRPNPYAAPPPAGQPAYTNQNAGYTNLWYGFVPWPVINNGALQNDLGKAYDLWHSAVNSRGLAFSAENAAALVGAIKSSLNRIKVPMSAQSGVSVSSTKLTTTPPTVVYEASYVSSDWHGVVGAYPITSGGISTTANWTTLPSTQFVAPASRSVISSQAAGTAATASVAGGVQVLSTDTNFMASWPSGANPSIVDWVRGDQTQEMPKGPYRKRTVTVLGDIIDSGPVFSWHEDYGYAGLAPEGGSYPAFVASKGNATGNGYSGNGMVYVGANDGMLHGFDAMNGNEIFGYVPHNVIPNLPALSDPAYAHRFYVDQTSTIGDACVGSGPTSCAWKTVLVGTTGPGGQGVFALDITHPESMGAASTAVGYVMWDLDGKGALSTNPTNPNGDPDLGYPIGKPMIARLNNGDWAAIFGNGYLSARGCAVLFIVRLSDGAITKIDTSGLASTSNCPVSNGLGPVALVDLDGNLTTDVVYAGDSMGNLWKFDLTSASSGAWKVALGGSPLFTASPGGSACASAVPNTCQPITSAPVVGPPLPGMTGPTVYFGTGRMFAIGDATTTSTQALYGIVDSGSPITGGPGVLSQQTIKDVGTTRTITGSAVNAYGWVANLPDVGERVTISPLLANGYVVFATDVPNSNTCTASGTGWIMAIPTTTTALGANTNFFLSSPGVAGVATTNGMPEGMTMVYDPTSKTNKLIVGESGGPQTITTSSLTVTGRISWHELTR